jgi:enoyl-CoA hydratase/carnithine racemase
MVTVLTVRDVAAGAAHADLLADDASAVDPLLLVDLDFDQDAVTEAELHCAIGRARECDRILVGVARDAVPEALLPLADALDLTVVGDAPATADAPRCAVPVPDPMAVGETLRARAEAAPQPALLLARLLRIGESLSVSHALDLESLTYSNLLAGPSFAQWLAARGERRPAPAPQTTDAVLIRRDGGLLHLTLNRPDRRNAHSRDLRDALIAGLRIAELDDTVTDIVLDGRGPAFCSGGDLDEFGTAPDPATAHLIRTRAGAARSLHAVSARLTARVHGHCVGAGIELPAFAGSVVADPASVFRLPELDMGLIPGAGGTVSIPRRIGRWRTLYLVLTAAPISAELALRWGLVDQVETRVEPVAQARVQAA